MTPVRRVPAARRIRCSRWLVGLTGVACLATVLVPKPATADDEIVLWHAYRGEEAAVLEQLVAEHKRETGTEVELLRLPYDAFASKLAAAIPLGEGPDIFIDSHERLGDFRHRGLVAPVGDALGSIKDYPPKVLTAVTGPQGGFWGVPLSLKSVALYVRTDLLDPGEIPSTLEALVALQPTLPEGAYALAYEARGAYAHAAFLGAFGGTMLTPDEQFGFVGPAAERSLEFVQSMIASGAVPGDADGALVTNLFRSGKAATAISGPWLANDLGSEVPYTVVVLPNIAAADGPMRPFLTVEALMLSPTGRTKQHVRALARHLSGQAAAQLRQQRARTISARNDVEPPTNDPVLRAFADQASTAVVMPSARAMRSTWEPANRAIRRVLRGQMSPQVALESARKQFDDVRRPPPPPASPTPWLIALGATLLLGALALVRRARDPDTQAALRASLPAYRYLVHAVFAVSLLVLAPLLVGAATSLFVGRPDTGYFVGLANFYDILTARGGPLLATGSFYIVVLVTLLWTLLNLVLHLAIGVGLGLVLSRPAMRLRGLYRVLLILPWAVPSYVTALAWRGMFHRQFGAVTGLIHQLNAWFGTTLEPIDWFARFSTAFTANVATNVWLGFPFMMVVTLGALTAVPRDALEAAEVDGASRWQRLRFVTLPMIRPALVPAAMLGAIWTFNMFNVVFLVSGGEPDGTTDILVSEAYRWAFTREAQYGYAAAYAVLIFVLLAGLTRLTERVGKGAQL